jgi:tetratricopeptide (TPR) repeat protein
MRKGRVSSGPERLCFVVLSLFAIGYAFLAGTRSLHTGGPWLGVRLGDSQRAISFAEETVTLRPERSEDWLELSRLYDREQRLDDARRARERAASINRGQASPTGPR